MLLIIESHVNIHTIQFNKTLIDPDHDLADFSLTHRPLNHILYNHWQLKKKYDLGIIQLAVAIVSEHCICK